DRGPLPQPSERSTPATGGAVVAVGRLGASDRSDAFTTGRVSAHESNRQPSAAPAQPIGPAVGQPSGSAPAAGGEKRIHRNQPKPGPRGTDEPRVRTRSSSGGAAFA